MGGDLVDSLAALAFGGAKLRHVRVKRLWL